MSLGLVLGLVAAAGWGVVDIAGALASRQIGSLRVQVGLLLASMVALTAFVLLRPDLLGADSVMGVLAGIPIGIFAAAGYISYMPALRLGPISVVSPVAVSYGGLSVVLAVVLRGESLTVLQALGAVLATGGVVLTAVVIDRRSLRSTRIVGPGVAFALATVVVFGFLGVLLAGPIRDDGWLPVMIGSRLGNTGAGVVLLAIALATRSRWFGPLLAPGHALTRRVLVLLVMAGTLDVVAFGAFSAGVEVGPVWIVTLASSFGPVLVVMFAIAQLGERLRPVQWMGLVLLGAGLAVLALAG